LDSEYVEHVGDRDIVTLLDHVVVQVSQLN
jgi:hypothetical protein